MMSNSSTSCGSDETARRGRRAPLLRAALRDGGRAAAAGELLRRLPRGLPELAAGAALRPPRLLPRPARRTMGRLLRPRALVALRAAAALRDHSALRVSDAGT